MLCEHFKPCPLQPSLSISKAIERAILHYFVLSDFTVSTHVTATCDKPHMSLQAPLVTPTTHLLCMALHVSKRHTYTPPNDPQVTVTHTMYHITLHKCTTNFVPLVGSSSMKIPKSFTPSWIINTFPLLLITRWYSTP